MSERRKHPRRRRSDRFLPAWLPERFYRDVWLLVITGIALAAIWMNQNTLTEQTKGRHFAVGVTCATLSAISDAGREVIMGPGGHETSFDRALEKLGYPPPNVRRAQARQAAQLYVEQISERVQRQVGGRGARLIRRDGTIDCVGLQTLANSATR